MRALRTRFVLLVATALTGAIGACSSTGGPGAEPGSTPEDVGSVDLKIIAPSDLSIKTFSYTITGPGGFTKSGTIDVSHSSKIAAAIGGLPAGSGFTITLTATSVDGTLTCAGAATFDIVAHQTMPVSVSLDCHEGARTGSALVTGQLNVCPQIDAVDANPAEVLVGGAVGLSATAHDTDHAPSALTYHWESSSGTLTDATAPSTRFTCTTPGSATIALTVSDGDTKAGCADTSSVTVQCTAPTSSNSCVLGNGAGAIKHVIYLQFDNTHLTRDLAAVPSDLEQMPHLLNFIRGNGTMMANDHTVLISHTAGGILSSLTGVYPDRHGQTVSNSYVRTSATGTFAFPSSFGYWTDAVAGTTIPNMVAPDGSNAPAPWVALTRAGCDVGAVAAANIVLENTGTTGAGDIRTVFGDGSAQLTEAINAKASSDAKTRASVQSNFVGFAVHCAQGSALCAAGESDLLPGEPGGYVGYKGLFGAEQIDPILTGSPASVPLVDLLGNPITDPLGNPGFPGFDGMSAAATLSYVAAMQEHGIPITYAYISDAHDFHGVSGNAHLAYGPGEAGYVQQLKDYDQAFANFFTRLASHGIDQTNTLFVVTVDEGDHFAGGTPTPVDCDGVNVPCVWTGQVGEANANIDTLVQHQFPSLFANFLGGSAPNTFTVHGDDAPTFYLAKRSVGPLGQLDPDTRTFERTIAGLTAVNPYTAMTDRVMVQMADQTGMKALHMITTGDPARNATFAFFGDANYFITDFPTSTCETCINPAFAWNHGDIQKEIGQTWVGFVGPGVASQADQTVFTDHVDVRPTINALIGVRDLYQADGRVITQAMVPGAVPAGLGADKATAESLGDYYKRINAPFGQFAADILITSTKALQGADMGDTIYTSKEASIANLTAQRDTLAGQIRTALDGAAFAAQPIDPMQAAGWISQAQALLVSADTLAAAP